MSSHQANPLPELERRLQELLATNQQLHQALKEREVGGEQEIRRLQGEKKALLKQLNDSQLLVRKLQERNTLLKGIMIKGNQDDDPLDDLVVRLFCELRDRIQTLVSRECTVARPKLDRKLDGEFFDMRKAFFHDVKGDMTDPERRFRIRAKIFNILYQKILTGPCYGLSDDGLENNLANFETLLILSGKGMCKRS